VVWIPGAVIPGVVAANGSFRAMIVPNLIAPIQAIATTCAILTKEDVRNYIWDLVILSYIFGKKK